MFQPFYKFTRTNFQNATFCTISGVDLCLSFSYVIDDVRLTLLHLGSLITFRSSTWPGRSHLQLTINHQGPVVGRPINANPILKVNRGFHLARLKCV